MHPAENYQLKFQQHGLHLNSAIATLYRNEKFADVVLFSSNANSIGISGSGLASMDNGMPAVGISAHKFILSANSQFFAAMFETAPIAAPNGVYYIVLPPDLSYRAIQILVQYIYTGEATVPNDVLNEVLRGGEILKIRGLYRAPPLHHEASNNNANNRLSHLITQPPPAPPPPPPTAPQSQSTLSSMAPSSISSQLAAVGGQQASNEKFANAAGSRCTANANNNSARYAVDYAHSHSHLHSQSQAHNHIHAHTHGHSLSLPLTQSQLQSHLHAQPHSHQYSQSLLRGLGASVLPKDSPVIVKSPKLSQMPLLAAGRGHHQHNAHKQQCPSSNGSSGVTGGGAVSTGGITVNKEFGIDPEVKCCFQLAPHESMPPTTSCNSATAQLCTEIGCASCTANMLEAENINTPRDRDRGRERERDQERERQLSQSDDILSHTLGAVERSDREYIERSLPVLVHEHEHDDIPIEYERHIRRSSATERSAREYFMSDVCPHSSTASITSSKQFILETTTTTATDSTTDMALQSPPNNYSHSFITIKQEPADWSATPTITASHEGNCNANNNKGSNNKSDNNDSTEMPTEIPTNLLNVSESSKQQPLDFKMPLGGTSVKLEVQSSHSLEYDESASLLAQPLVPPAGHALISPSDIDREFVSDAIRYDETKISKQWLLNRSKGHSASNNNANNNDSNTTPSNSLASSSSSSSSSSAYAISTTSSNGNGLTKSYVPKKKRRVSQQENTVDHVPLHCDICSRLFDTPAEWVRHMNNQHTEVELALFNSRKEHERNENASASVSACSATSSNNNYQQHNQHPHQQQQQQHHQQQQQQQQQHEPHQHSHNNQQLLPNNCNKKYNSPGRTTLSAAHNNLLMQSNNNSNSNNNNNNNNNINNLTSNTSNKNNSNRSGNAAAPTTASNGIIMTNPINNSNSNTNHINKSHINSDADGMTATRNDVLDGASSSLSTS